VTHGRCHWGLAAMNFKNRMDKTFKRYGEDFLVNSVTSARGFFQRIDDSLVSTYFDGAESASADGCGLMVMVPADTVLAVGDTVIRHGRTYTVAKTASRRIGNAVVMHMLLLR